MDVYGRLDMRGKFWVQRASRITDLVWTAAAVARLVYAKQTDGLWFGGETQWRQLTHARDLINDGQRLVFMTYPLPTNWTLETDGINDRAILVTNNNTQIGRTGGSWIISGMDTQDARHNHFATAGIGLPNTSRVVGSSEIYSRSANLSHRHYMSNDEKHTHTFDGSWRPAYTKAVIGYYNA